MTAGAFDTSRHTCRGDVASKEPELVVTLRWTKTLQDCSALAKIPINAIPRHHIEPVACFHNMLALVPTKHTQDPLLTLPGGTIITSVYLGTTLHFILTSLGQPTQLYSLHSLHRGGATASFQTRAEYISIKCHGTWASDSFWEYITTRDVADSPVAKALAIHVGML